MPPIVIAHRGASGYVPEHTLMSKAMAHAFGADFLEQDVVASKDGVPIVMHDVQIDTVTDVAKKFPDGRRRDGRYYAIDFTIEQLKQLTVSERFNPRTGKAIYPHRYPVGDGEFKISTLDEELTFIANINRTTGREAGIYPEIKRPAWHREQGCDLSTSIIDVLRKHGYMTKHDRCYLQCFDETEVKRVREELHYHGLLIQLISHGHDVESGTDYKRLMSPAGLAEIAEFVDGIGPRVDEVISWSENGEFTVSDLVVTAHKYQLAVHPWTFRADALPKHCPQLESMFEAFIHHANIDGLFVDHPDRAIRFLHSAFPTEKPQ